MKSSHLVLVECPDQVGLIALLTNVFSQEGLNITSLHEFVDPMQKQFFFRVSFEGDYKREKLLSALKSVLPRGHQIKLVLPALKKLAILTGKEPHCLGDLLMRAHYGHLPAGIEVVLSNHPDREDLAKAFNIPYHALSHEGLGREAHEAKILETLTRYQFDYLILAKYMRILSSPFVDRFRGKIINIHHSFLPAFIGARPYHQAYERGVKIIGATAHFVTSDLDEGPIIVQDVCPVTHTATPEKMIAIGQDREKITLARAVQLVCEDRVFISGNRTIIFE